MFSSQLHLGVRPGDLHLRDLEKRSLRPAPRSQALQEVRAGAEVIQVQN